VKKPKDSYLFLLFFFAALDQILENGGRSLHNFPWFCLEHDLPLFFNFMTSGITWYNSYVSVSRELWQAITATRTPPNKRFNEQNMAVHVRCKSLYVSLPSSTSATWNELGLIHTHFYRKEFNLIRCDWFILWHRVFPLSSAKRGKRALRVLTDWKRARLTRELARSNSYAAGEELVTGFRVLSDLPLLEIRTVETELHPLILLSSIATSTYTVIL